MHPDHNRYVSACQYPGSINPATVEAELQKYLTALGIKRHVVQLKAGWTLDEHPPLRKGVEAVLANIKAKVGESSVADGAISVPAAKEAQDAIWTPDAHYAQGESAALSAATIQTNSPAAAAQNGRSIIETPVTMADSIAHANARRAEHRQSDALHRFAAWCVQSSNWWWRWELSLVVTTWFGATTEAVKAWSKPLFEAFIAGAWLLHWTEDTLYWVQKPKVHTDDQRRLHNETGPAVESDVESLFFVHGVIVPEAVVMRPESITVTQIDTETNAEVRRVMMERMGFERYLIESGTKPIHSDDYGDLYRREIPGDEPLVMVRVINSTPEADGSFRNYMLRVSPTAKTAREAVAWTFGKSEAEYAPGVET